MKTALVISALVVGSHLLTNPFASRSETTIAPEYKMTKSRKTASAPIAPVRIVVDKSSYELYVYDAQGWYATYPVVFGNKGLEDKRMEGDRNTPEGSYRIVAKRVHNKWSRFLSLDYPNKPDLAKVEERK